MIRLAWRIAVLGRSTARATLLVRALGIGLGTAIILLALGAPGALDARGDRTGWRDEDSWRSSQLTTPELATIQVLPIEDRYDGLELTRVLVATHSEDAPAPPGFSAPIAPGEVFASPALRALIEDDEAGLGRRFGAITGEIDGAGLAEPDELVAVIGVTPEELGDVGLFFAELPRGAVDPGVTNFLRILAVIGAVTLLAPVALFIAAAARLDAQQGEVRLAAFRLAGATPQAVRRYVATEAALSIVPGLVIGLGLFFLARQAAPWIAYLGHGFYPSDVGLSWQAIAFLAVVPVLVVGASLWGMRGVEVSPLGVRRGVSTARPRPWGVAVLLLGLAVFAWALGQVGQPALPGIGLGMVMIILGLTMTGPWIGRILSRIGAGMAGRPWLLLALRRISTDTGTSFRTVAGVSLAVFLGTFFLTVADAAEGEATGAIPDSGVRTGTLIVQDPDQQGDLPEGLDVVTLDYRSVVPMDEVDPTSGLSEGDIWWVYLGSCKELARALVIDSCGEGPVLARDPGAWSAGQEFGLLRDDGTADVAVRLTEPPGTFTLSSNAWRAPNLIIDPSAWTEPAAEPGNTNLNQGMVVIPPPGEPLEVTRSRVIEAAPTTTVLTPTEEEDAGNAEIAEIRQLVYIGIFTSFVISGATGVISVAGSLLARRVPFSLLRLTGCPTGVLRRALFTEALLPLLLMSVLSVGTGLLCGFLVVRRATSDPFLLPSTIGLPLVGGLALGIALLLPILPMVGPATRFTRTRFD